MSTCLPQELSEFSRSGRVKLSSSRIPVRVSGGPFHYHIRAGTYGDMYDEVPWKVAFGIAQDKGRDPTDRSCFNCHYRDGVLLHNWVEERRDKSYFLNKRTVLPSEYDWMYRSTYRTDFKKTLCRKEKSHLQAYYDDFPMPIYPGHQQELDIPCLKCAPKPSQCELREKRENRIEETRQQERDRRDHPPEPVPTAYDIYYA